MSLESARELGFSETAKGVVENIAKLVLIGKKYLEEGTIKQYREMDRYVTELPDEIEKIKKCTDMLSTVIAECNLRLFELRDKFDIDNSQDKFIYKTKTGLLGWANIDQIEENRRLVLQEIHRNLKQTLIKRKKKKKALTEADTSDGAGVDNSKVDNFKVDSKIDTRSTISQTVQQTTVQQTKPSQTVQQQAPLPKRQASLSEQKASSNQTPSIQTSVESATRQDKHLVTKKEESYDKKQPEGALTEPQKKKPFTMQSLSNMPLRKQMIGELDKDIELVDINSINGVSIPKITVQKISDPSEIKNSIFYNGGRFYMGISNKVYKMPFIQTLDPNDDNSRVSTVRCRYGTRQNCRKNRLRQYTHIYECTFAHIGEQYNKIGSIYRCNRIPHFGRMETLAKDMEMMTGDEINHILMYALGDVLLCHIWLEKEKIKNKKGLAPSSLAPASSLAPSLASTSSLVHALGNTPSSLTTAITSSHWGSSSVPINFTSQSFGHTQYDKVIADIEICK